MGIRTSIYLSDDLHAAVKASGETVAEIIRRGLGERAPEAAAAQEAAEAVAGEVREAVASGLHSAAAEAVQGAHADAQDALAEIVERAVRSALRDMQGGSW